jgi:threonine dehydrogenase-like Zn-dependent dehydrogenase
VTGTTVCGSDLHLYHAEIPDLRTGEVLGHEGIGVVAEVGPEVKNFKIGDRVVSPFSIGCGECWYCQRDLPSMCSMTNKSTMQNYLWGDRIGSVIGYSHFLGGLDGAQASWLRIPYADTNAFKVDESLPDEKVGGGTCAFPNLNH